MILTVTLNPLLERRFIYKKVLFGSENRSGTRILGAGGKGINVSRQLNQLNVQNNALIFLGGNNGKVLKDVLYEDKISFTHIRTESETRECAIIFEKEEKSLSTFFGPNAKITKSEVNEFKHKLDKTIQNCQIVVFSGSSPCEETNSIIPIGIELANKYDKISICDTYGKHLNICIDSKPTILHNNINELEKSLGISLSSEKKVLSFLDVLYKKDIKQIYLTNGKNPGYALTFGFKYKIENPDVNLIDATGSGDSFVAGIAYGLHNSLVFEETVKIAASLGAANAGTFETSNVKLSDISEYLDKISIFPIGKKMKTLDVTPH